MSDPKCLACFQATFYPCLLPESCGYSSRVDSFRLGVNVLASKEDMDSVWVWGDSKPRAFFQVGKKTDDYVGTLWFPNPQTFGAGLLAHECLHAAFGVHAWLDTGIAKSKGVLIREETICCVISELVKEITNQFYSRSLWG